MKSASCEAPRYEELIRRFGELALELGCGDGDLLDLRTAGLDVDGIDSSPDMIKRLGRQAAERSLTVKDDEVDVPRCQATATGSISVRIAGASRDPQGRTQTLTLRYERVVSGQTETLERDWAIH